jgi:hypothetical protein
MLKHLTPAVLSIGVLGTPAAACFICDVIVEFDPLTAQCFVENVPDYLARAQQDTAGRVEVNLTTCSPERSVDAFPTFKRAREDGEAGVGTIYTLDVTSVQCLADRLSQTEITDVVSYNIEEDC